LKYRLPAWTTSVSPFGISAMATTYSSRVFTRLGGIWMILLPLPLGKDKHSPLVCDGCQIGILNRIDAQWVHGQGSLGQRQKCLSLFVVRVKILELGDETIPGIAGNQNISVCISSHNGFECGLGKWLKTAA
jgi:hypothetical protein